VVNDTAVVTPLSTTTYYVEAASAAGPYSGTQTYSSPGTYSYTVPAGVTSLTVDVRGARGGNAWSSGGLGGRVTGTVPVTPGQTIQVNVGAAGQGFAQNNCNCTIWTASSSFNGGGIGRGRDGCCGNWGVGAGGGASDLRIGGTGLSNRIVVAGGGGGAGGQSSNGGFNGGQGGGLTGGNGSGFNPGSGGTPSTGGSSSTQSGSFGIGGDGNISNWGRGGGGGGGGWYGGGGGWDGGGGGGGSSYTDPTVTGVNHQQGQNSGDGFVSITWSKTFCVSPRVPVVALINNLTNPTPVPDTVNCSASATLSVSGSSGSFRWYTQPTGGSAIAQGSILATQPMFQPTTYYVEAFNPLNTCLSARVPVQVLIDSLPLPTIAGSDTLCDNGSTIFTASGGSGTYTWHATPGGPVLQSGATYSTGAVTSPVTVYARYGSGSCFSGYAPGVLLIVPTPVATITAPSALCSSDPIQQFTAPSTGGTWSGNGIVNASTGSFNPSSASLGSNQIIYSINTLGCSDADTVQVTINQGPSVSIVNPGPQCTQNAALTLSSSTPGGTWSGPGITSASNGSFDPSVALSGVHDVIYSLTVSGCTGSDTVQIPVYANPSASLSNPGPLCSTAGAVALVPQTSGGVFTGSALSNPSLGVFDPSLAQAGLNTVVYTVSQNGCSSTDSVQIQVNTTPSAVIQSPGVLCSAQNTVVLSAASPGGTWIGVGIQNAVLGTFSPSSAQLGGNVVTYSVSQNGCSDQQSLTITVNQSPDATISSAPASVCSNAGLLTLNSLFSGGTWSGPGIVNSSAGTLQPSSMNSGNNTITYSLTQNGCTSQQSVVISRLQAPNGTILSQPGQVCSNASDVNLFATSPGGFWTGNGIVNAANGTFSPSFAGTGLSTIIYNVTQNGCNDGDTIQINVVSAPVTQVSPSGSQQACEGVGIPMNASGASSYQWYLNGQAISGATGSSYTAQLNGTYTVEGVSNGCNALSSQVQAQLSARPEILSVVAPSVCEGLSTPFTNTSVVAGNNGAVITGYQWSYGDGNTGQGIQSQHTYSSAGQYQSQLVVMTNQGCSDTLSQTVFVNPRPQIQSATAPNVCQPLSTQFSAGATVSPINNASVTGYQWSFGNGLSGSGATTSHTYQSASAYTWVLRVTSNHGCVSEQSGQTEVFRQPDAGFLVNNVCTNVPAQFLDISDAYGDQITSWQWNFGDNVGTSTQQNPFYAYNVTPGQYPVSLTIQTASGCTDVKYQFVQLTPSPNALWTGVVQGNSTVNFAPVNPNPSATFIWHFPGDNTYAYQMNVSKTFPGDGSYPVCLTVQLNGCESTECSSITLNTTGVSTLDDAGISVYPNPSEGLFTVDMSGSKVGGTEVELTLRDMLGREVLVSRGASGVFDVDARGVATGTYLLVLTTEEGVYQSKMVITR
jgi:PKD repeat protein